MIVIIKEENFLIKEESLLIMLFGPSYSLREGMAFPWQTGPSVSLDQGCEALTPQLH